MPPIITTVGYRHGGGPGHTDCADDMGPDVYVTVCALHHSRHVGLHGRNLANADQW